MHFQCLKLIIQVTYISIISSTLDAIGPTISTVPPSHKALQKMNAKQLVRYLLLNNSSQNTKAYPLMSVRPYVVFNPTTPQREEGIRIEPEL